MLVKVSGVTFTNEDGSSRKEIIAGIPPKAKVHLEREPSNKYDPCAVKVCVLKDDLWQQIGYLPKTVAAEVSPALAAGQKYFVALKDAGVVNDLPFCELLLSKKIKQPYQKPYVYLTTKSKKAPVATQPLPRHLAHVAKPPRPYRGYRRRWEHDPNFDPRGGQWLLLAIAVVFLLLFYILPMIFWGEPIFD